MEKAKFATTARGVAAPAEWLAIREGTTVAMESTGVYWKPVFYRIEGLFEEVWLVNAQHVQNVPGRKTDMIDAEWLADVVAHGMVRPSFVPPPDSRELRELTRYRKNLVDERAPGGPASRQGPAGCGGQTEFGGVEGADQVRSEDDRSAHLRRDPP